MVQAMINIDEHANRIYNIIKAQYGLKNKSEAIERLATEYEAKNMQPELRPEFIKEIQEIEKKGKFKKYSSVKELYNEIEGTPS